MSLSGRRGVVATGGCPIIGADIVSAAGVQKNGIIQRSAPDDHFAAGQHCGVTVSSPRHVSGASSVPTICAGSVYPTSIQSFNDAIIKSSAPDDHLAADPDRCVNSSAIGRVRGAGGCPTITDGIVSPTGIPVMIVRILEISAPDNHFAAGPHCGVISSGSWRVGRYWWLPSCQCWDYIGRRCSNRC